MKIIFLMIAFFLFVPHALADSETVKGAKKDLDTFKSEMTTKLNEVDRQLDELRAKAKANGKAAQEQTTRELEEKRARLKAQLDSLSDEGKSNWKKMKKSVSESVDALHDKVKKALED